MSVRKENKSWKVHAQINNLLYNFSQFKNASGGFSFYNFHTTAQPIPAAILRFAPPFYAKRREIRAALVIYWISGESVRTF